MMKNKPNFFIVGTPKAGTTSLYHYLDEHPEVFVSPVKETNFFSYNEIKDQGLFYGEEHISTLAQYESQFVNAGSAKAIGEASVSYLFYPSVPAKIKQYSPDAKIIVILRNPVERGYSHYLMDKRLGLVRVPYEDIIEKKGITHKNELFYQQYVSLGCYYEQLKRYIDQFGRDSVKVFLQEDLIADMDKTMTSIYQFLGVDTDFKLLDDKSYNTFSAPKNKIIEKLYAARGFRKLAKAIAGNSSEKVKNLFMTKGKKVQLTDTLKCKLLEIYKEDVLATQELIGRDLQHWLK